MKRLLMPEIRTAKYIIPKGWIATVPDFSASPDYEASLTGSLLPMFAFNRDKAVAEARDRIDQMCREAFMKHLRSFLQRCADDYGRRYPDLVQPNKTLKGFSPELMSKAFLPYRKTAGRHPHPEIFKILSGMAQEGRGAPTLGNGTPKKDGAPARNTGLLG